MGGWNVPKLKFLSPRPKLECDIFENDYLDMGHCRETVKNDVFIRNHSHGSNPSFRRRR